MKLAISNIAWNEEEDSAVYTRLHQCGVKGIEIAPTRWFTRDPYEKLAAAQQLAQEIKKKYSLSVVSMQSILFGREESLFGSTEERERLSQYLKRAIDFADSIGCKNLVFGSPKNRILPEGVPASLAVEFFYQIAEYAWQYGVVLSIEPNPVIYGTNYITTTESAFALAKEVSHPGFRVNLDCGTIVQNNESVEKIAKNFHLVQHIHISEPCLANILPRQIHRELLGAVKGSGYDRYVSIEMKRSAENPLQAITQAVEYIHSLIEEGR